MSDESIFELNKSLNLHIPSELVEELRIAGFVSLNDVLQKDSFSVIMEENQENHHILEQLQAHANLSVISSNYETNNNLIEQGFDSVTAIGTASKEDFIEQTKEKITEEQALKLHVAARVQVATYKQALSGHLRQRQPDSTDT